jgi:hypothetical protein
MIKLMVEAAVEKPPLPEAPISITVMAYLRGFQVLITRRMGEQAVLSQIPGVVALIKGLEEAGFEPARGCLPLTLSNVESKERGKEKENPICAIHHKPMAWREGITKQTGKHYAFWSCTERNSDGSFCKYRPEDGK